MSDREKFGSVSDQSAPESEPTDPIIEAVKNFNRNFNNSRYQRQEESRIGQFTIYTVSFLGQQDRSGKSWSYRNYVLTHQSNPSPKVFNTLDDLLKSVQIIRVEPWRDIEFIKAYLLVFIVFSLVLCLGVAIYYDMKSTIPILMTTLGSIIGFLIGDRRS